ncbi:MAG TPA: carboxypeptidase-like regulatory domain-containing protein [Bryobacteraceae bacterium]|nr:carboxypeptidase-like regulatory domain-containing protein [Bryobacteraceae bacterium]
MNRYVAILFFTAVTVIAQTNRGGISGTVSDQSGGVIPSATVVIVNVGTNETRRLTTGDKGSFMLENLEPVTYRIEVSANGFKKAVLEDVKVDTSSTVSVNLILHTGDVATEVTVSANAAVVNTESGTLGQTISARLLDDTPLPTRSVLDLAITVGNVTGDVGSSDPQLGAGNPLPGFNLQANGGRAGSMNLLADGISNTGVGLARESVSFSPEVVQEFTVLTNGFDAQYGKSGGGIISVTTKSGSNDLHGLALWYVRNPAANAAPFTQASVNRPVNNLRWNQFDGQAGGPVVIPKLYNGRNKTFFFFSGEPRYQSDKSQTVATVPTDDMRKGDFSNLVKLAGQNAYVPTSLKSQFPASAFLPNDNTNIYNQFIQVGKQFVIAPLATGAIYPQFPGNRIPDSMIDPVALKLMQYVPKANTPYFLDSNGVIQDYVSQQYLSNISTRYTTRIDNNLGSANHLSFRWTTQPVVGISANDPAFPMNGNSGSYSKSTQYTISDTHIFSPTIVNELRLAYTRADFSGQLSPQFDVKTGENLSLENGLPSLTHGGVPLINIYDNSNSPANIGSQVSTLGYSLEQQYEIADNVYITRGSSTWKFGVDLSRALMDSEFLYSLAGGNYQFRFVQTDQTGAAGTQSAIGGNPVASFLLGVPNSIALANTAIPYYYQWSSGAAYVQNDWRVRPNLTLNLGLRYSLQLPRIEKNNLQGFLDPSLAQTVQLKTPCQLPDCKAASATTGLPVITQATMIPFAFSGYGGRSRYLTPIRWLDFEPRFGFAYTPSIPMLHAWVVRGGYGISHAPLTGQNRNPVPNFTTGAANYGETAGQTITTPIPVGDGTSAVPVTRLSSNPPFVPAIPANQVLGLVNNPSGLVFNNAINFPGAIRSGETAVPYVQNWSLSFQRQLGAHGLFELSYAGAKGTHLFMPSVVLNNPPSSYLASLVNLNVKATTNIPDPVGRSNSSGGTLSVPLYSLASPYLGYASVNSFYDASGSSIFHAALVSYRWQAHHLTMYTNFRWSKSIDNASDSSPDKFALSTGSVGGGQYSFGATAANDRSVSTFNIPYAWNFVAVYDLPYGKGRMFGASAWKPLQLAFGEWTLSGVERITSGYPFTPTIAADNYIDTVHTHEIRPNIVPGVPLINPDWKRSCPTGNLCAPYVNYSAFELPPAGDLGNAPRTIAGITGPMVQTLDLSVQKSFSLGEKRRLQFRVDALNALNHPVFRTAPNVGGGTDLFGNYPTFAWSASSIQTVYNSWAAANPGTAFPTTDPRGAAALASLQTMILSQQNASGALPKDFYTLPLPAHFSSTPANSFNILDPSGNGFKFYEIRNNINSGGAIGGGLQVNNRLNQQRYLQFGIKLYF